MTYSLCIAIEAFLEFLSPKIAKLLTAAEKDFYNPYLNESKFLAKTTHWNSQQTAKYETRKIFCNDISMPIINFYDILNGLSFQSN